MSSAEFIDIHSHNHEPVKNIFKIVNIFPKEFDKIKSHKNIFYSVGIHPWYIDDETTGPEINKITEIIKNEKFIGIGEIGLDRLSASPLEKQIEVYESQVMIAVNYRKPVIIHCVKAFPEIITLKKKLKIDVPAIIHGFNRNKQILHELIRNGFYISIGYKLLDQNSNAGKLLNEIPENRLFFETDEKEINIEEIYKKAALIKGITVSHLKEIIENNFKEVFNYKIDG